MTVSVLNSIINLLWPGVNMVFGQYEQWPKQWQQMGYQTKKSIMSYETQVEMQYGGLASIVAEGTNIPSTIATQQKFVTTYTHKKLAIFQSFSKESIDDNLYKNAFPDNLKSNLHSIEQAKNTLAADIFNNAFRTDPQFLLGDGKPLASTEHPITGGVYANTFPADEPSADLSEYGLQKAITIIQKMVDQAGLLVNIKPKKLLVSLDNQFSAARLLKSEWTPSTPNNAINPIFNGNYFPEGFVYSPYFTSPSRYFIVTDAPQGLTHFERQKLTHNMFPNYNNETINFLATSRDSWGISNPRGVFCAR